jgi:hypothetical protein
MIITFYVSILLLRALYPDKALLHFTTGSNLLAPDLYIV